MDKSPRQVDFLNLTLDALTMDEAVERCIEWLRNSRSPRVVMPLNAALVVAMKDDRALLSACRNADLRVADGASIVWASRLNGERIPERIAGIDLMQRLVERAAQEGLSVFFLGAKPEVVERLVERYRALHPQLRIAGFRDGYFSEAEQPALVRQIRASDADMLFIGMPSPFKEVWAETFREALGTPLIMGVGGSFDVLAGFIARAPSWVQRAGLEWLWRLLCEPRRMWKRYLVSNAVFIVIVIKASLRRLSQSRK